VNLAEHVEIAVAGHAARVLDSVITAKLALLFLCGAGKPQRLKAEQNSEKSHADNQRQNECLLDEMVFVYSVRKKQTSAIIAWDAGNAKRLFVKHLKQKCGRMVS
jgi:hypothetical protein